jgi:hypothetical protein
MNKFTCCLIFAEFTGRTNLTCSSGVHPLLSASVQMTPLTTCLLYCPDKGLSTYFLDLTAFLVLT